MSCRSSRLDLERAYRDLMQYLDGSSKRLLTLEGGRTTGQAGDPAIRSRSMYVAYPGIGAYCMPSCTFVEEAPPVPVTHFATREDAEGAGNMPCAIYRPDLNPMGFLERPANSLLRFQNLLEV